MNDIQSPRENDKDYVLWGFKPGGPSCYRKPIKIFSGSLRSCRFEQKRRSAEGWRFGIYLYGDAPEGLRALVEDWQR